jgi:hypothetical protein
LKVTLAAILATLIGLWIAKYAVWREIGKIGWVTDALRLPYKESSHVGDIFGG